MTHKAFQQFPIPQYSHTTIEEMSISDLLPHMKDAQSFRVR